MNEAVSAIALAKARARRKVIAHFSAADATSPARAIPYQTTGRSERALVEELQDKGVLRPSSNGGQYLVPDKLEAWQRARRKRGGLILAGALALAAAAIGLVAAN